MLEADAQLMGYWSDGTADVSATVVLSNAGDLPLKGAQSIAVECRRGDDAVPGCPEALTVELPDGFSAAGIGFGLRVSMGHRPIDISFSVDDGPLATVEISVPERILGVGRHVWECYADLPGHMNRCGGWRLDTSPVQKWQPGEPIRVWAYGRPDYLAALDEILSQMSELLNHSFQMVGSREESDLVVGVGISSFPDSCIGGAGCGSADRANSVAVSGESYVRDLGGTVPIDVISHELFHALIPQGHYPSPYHLLFAVEDLSTVDEAILRFHANPLIKPGMTAQQVRSLVVFEDELLDAQPAGAGTLAWRARETLLREGTAAFTAKGTCIGDTAACLRYGTGEFSWTDLTIGELRLPGNHLQKLYLREKGLGAYVAGKEFWLASDAGWRSVEWDDFFRETGWRPNNTSLLTVLENILLLAHDGDLEVAETPNGDVALRTLQGRELRLISDYLMGVSLALDKETYRATHYTVTICGPGDSPGCFFEIQAIDGRYGAELAIPEQVRQSTPLPVRWEGTDAGTTISSGLHHTCALRMDGSVACWGADSRGRSTPPGGGRFVSIASGGNHTCGLRQDGSVVCWGYGLGQDNHYASRDGLWTSPTDANREFGYNAKPLTIGRFTSLSAGRPNTCAIRPDKSLLCWGAAGDDAPSGDEFSSVSVGEFYACALKTNGTPVCWGDGRYGQTSPPEGERFTAISSGALQVCGLRPDGTPACWGDNTYGQTEPPEGVKLTSVSSGGLHVCGLRADDGSPVCWGWNSNGQTRAPRNERFVAISSGGYFSCGLRENGTVACWGDNDSGQSSPPRDERFAVLSSSAPMGVQ